MTESKVSTKLLIDTQNNRVLFSEANKDCVDFLFNILSLPMGTVIRLLPNQEMLGSVANLYQSIKNLNESYIQPGQNKDILFKPIPLPRAAASVPLLLLNDARPEKKYYRCSQKCSICMYSGDSLFGSGSNSSYFSDDPSVVCPPCKQNINSQMSYVAPPAPLGGQASSTKGGFVKVVMTYMVMDDLVVKPMSKISSITLLNKSSVKDVSALQEKEVNIGSTVVCTTD